MTLSYRENPSGSTLEFLIELRVGCFTLLSVGGSLKVSVRELASKRINKIISDYYPDTCTKKTLKKRKKWEIKNQVFAEKALPASITRF